MILLHPITLPSVVDVRHADLAEALGIRFDLAGDVLTVRFRYAPPERWVAARGDVSLDDSAECIEYRGRIYVPASEVSR